MSFEQDKLILQSWKLSANTKNFLLANPDVLESLVIDRSREAFSAEYTPQLIDFLFDDRLYIRLLNGRLKQLEDCPKDYQPDFVEIRFDGECALFLCQGEEIINRLENIVGLDSILQQSNLNIFI